jgi:hypothetical protein
MDAAIGKQLPVAGARTVSQPDYEPGVTQTVTPRSDLALVVTMRGL